MNHCKVSACMAPKKPSSKVTVISAFQPSTMCFLFLYLCISGVVATVFTITNKCDHTVWPGLLSNAGVSSLSTTGFALQAGETKSIVAPASWAGRMWGRTHCSQDSTGRFSCVTGDCSSGMQECSGNGHVPPATLLEFTLAGFGGLDYFAVSLVDGYNLPVLVEPQGRSGQNCLVTGCVVDLNQACPFDLKVSNLDDKSVACKSACEAFRQPQYCCEGAYNTSDTCKPTSYSQLFKRACPRAYSYAYDDETSTFTCSSVDYLITFCPTPNIRQKASKEPSTPRKRHRKGTARKRRGKKPLTNDNEGASDQNGASPFTFIYTLVLVSIAAVLGVVGFNVYFGCNNEFICYCFRG